MPAPRRWRGLSNMLRLRWLLPIGEALARIYRPHWLRFALLGQRFESVSRAARPGLDWFPHDCPIATLHLDTRGQLH